jgi:UPF0755 protein
MLIRAAAASLLLAAAAAVPWVYFSLSVETLQAEPVVVELPRGTGTMQALRALRERGLIGDPWAALLWLKAVHPGKPLQAGEYEFAGTVAAPRVLDKLVRGEVLLHRVTFPEGDTLFEHARTLDRAGLCAAADFEAAAMDASPVRGFAPEATDLEGFLFPETYAFPRGLAPRRMAEAMTANFEKLWRVHEDEVRAAGLSPLRWATLASIVEREARLSGEKPVIAGVFLNRLRRGMPLQADPTVLYAFERRGMSVARLTRLDLAVDSPYNTYRRSGLPPGPIGNPGREALLAVLRPVRHDLLYFVAAGAGAHVFAATLEEHNRNVAAQRRRR